jgi:hypothetical protein
LLADFKLIKAKVNKGRWELGAPPPKRARAAGPQAAVASLPTRGRITLRGLTSGDIGLEGSGSKGRCILVGDKFCAWLPHTGFLGLKIVGVLLQSADMLRLLDHKFGNDCDIQIGQWEAANMHADVLLVDGPASLEVLQVASRSHAKLVLSTTRKRSHSLSNTGWKLVSRERISHPSVGGITERVGDFSVHQPVGANTLMVGTSLSLAVPRDASTVLSLTKHAKFFRPKPKLEVIDPLRCVNLGSSDKPIYHGRGLLPAALSHDTWVLTPFLYSPKANK